MQAKKTVLTAELYAKRFEKLMKEGHTPEEPLNMHICHMTA